MHFFFVELVGVYKKIGDSCIYGGRESFINIYLGCR